MEMVGGVMKEEGRSERGKEKGCGCRKTHKGKMIIWLVVQIAIQIVVIATPLEE